MKLLPKGLLGLLAVGSLAACATTPPPRPPIPTPAPTERFVAWSEVPGWDGEDHLQALLAFQASCGAGREPALAKACAAARAARPTDERTARAFFESAFRPAEILGEGLLTAYFAPEYEARAAPEPPFTAAVRGKPADLATADPSNPADPALAGLDAVQRLPDGALAPYPDRAAIGGRPAEGALAWMRPEDLFFLQIQGSGVLDFPDGRRMKALYAAANGRPFVSVAKTMLDRGLIAAANSDAIRAYLAQHRGPEADALMQLNPRYVFFRTAPDDGREPAGAAGVPLTPRRSAAVDPAYHPMGELIWIDAPPRYAGRTYRGLVEALDTGAAIKGLVRADLYLGSGDAAGREAGVVSGRLHMYRLEPAGSDAGLSLAATR